MLPLILFVKIKWSITFMVLELSFLRSMELDVHIAFSVSL